MLTFYMNAKSASLSVGLRVRESNQLPVASDCQFLVNDEGQFFFKSGGDYLGQYRTLYSPDLCHYFVGNASERCQNRFKWRRYAKING